MKEKLELKHVNPYADKALKGIFCGVEDIITGIDYEHGIISLLNGGNILIKDFKPLLHPLERLSMISDERFPINEHTINLLLEEKHGFDYGMFSHYKGELTMEIDGDSSAGYDMSKEIPFEVFLTVQEELCKGHFDYQNLIEKGLAEPIKI